MQPLSGVFSESLAKRRINGRSPLARYSSRLNPATQDMNHVGVPLLYRLRFVGIRDGGIAQVLTAALI